MMTILRQKQQHMGGWNAYAMLLVLSMTVLLTAAASAQTPPSSPGDTGCTYTSEFWMTHDGYDGPVLISWEELVDNDTMQLPVTNFETNKTTITTVTEKGQDADEVIIPAEMYPELTAPITYYDALHTAPNGRPWWELAKQMVPFMLNGLNGADSLHMNEEAMRNMVWTLLYNEHPESHDNTFTVQARAFAEILLLYNEGLIGPGRCEEDSN